MEQDVNARISCSFYEPLCLSFDWQRKMRVDSCPDNVQFVQHVICNVKRTILHYVDLSRRKDAHAQPVAELRRFVCLIKQLVFVKASCKCQALRVVCDGNIIQAKFPSSYCHLLHAC